MMNTRVKVILGSVAILFASVSVASAQTVNGTIAVTGSVAERCFVVPGAAAIFSDTFALGELAIAGGTVATKTDTGSFQVHCNTGTVNVGITADSLETGGAAPTGYSNIIHYTAQLDLTLATGSFTPITVISEAATSATTTSDTTTARLATGSTNVTVSLSALTTPNVTDLLVAGDYDGEIRVTIAPGT
jgi:hypothetical protein